MEAEGAMTEAEANYIEAWHERSAVLEHEAGKPRVIAESLALQEVVKRWGQDAGKVVQRHRERSRG